MQARHLLMTACVALSAGGALAEFPDAGEAVLDFTPASFDRGVDVCENPYAYVNNSWLRTTPLPADRPVWGPRYAVVARNQAMQRALAESAAARQGAGAARHEAALVGAFYASGMDEARIEATGLAPVASDLARIDAIASRRDVFEYIAATSAQGLDLVFNYYVWASAVDPDMHLAYVEQGGLGLPDREAYLAGDARNAALRDAYRAHLARLLALAGTPAAEASRQAADAFALEQALARGSLSRAELLGRYDRLFAQRSLQQARALAPHFDWAAYFAHQGHADVARIGLAQPAFFQALDGQLAGTDIAAWKAYLRTRLLDRMAPFLPRAFAEQHFLMHEKTLRGVPTMPPRWRRVLDALNATPASMAMSRLFVQAHLAPDAKPRALAMVADLRAAFRARIARADWMGAQTRRAALDKLDRMGAKIGYPDRWPELGGLAFDPGDYAGNVRAALRFANARDNAQLGQPVDRAEWHSPAHEVNARYYPQTNEIVFPAPMLLAPAFDPALDHALNYGALGIIIGHEMTHGFDHAGAKFAADGRLHDWWEAADRTAFERKGKRVSARYARFEIAPGKPVDGEFTLGENIADLGGLAIAYDALVLAQARAPTPAIDGLSQPQRFFLRYASLWRNRTRPEFAALRLGTDPHAPEEFRALGPLADMPAFSGAFGCTRGDAMHIGVEDPIGIW